MTHLTEWKSLDNLLDQQKDIVIVSVPWVDTQNPLAGPASLKQPIERAGFSCLAVDTNIEIVNSIKSHLHDVDLQTFFLDGIMSEAIEQEIYYSANLLADKILSWNPKWVGLSFLCNTTQYFGRWLIYFLRRKNKEIKIIIGGPGIGLTGSGEGDIFIDQLFESNLIDFYIQGDGEISFPELLQGNVNYPGINGNPWQYLTSDQLENLPFPDYSDYKLTEFWGTNSVSIGITASRGCVRNCTFCDYIETHKKFQWRRAENVFNEMLLQNQKYGTGSFLFADALVNGNTKEFNKLIELLADHNDKNPDNQFKWNSFYIIRNISADDEWVWETMKRSGAQTLAVGVEHFSQKIRYDIGKKINNDAVVHHMELAQKNKIKILVMIMLGYPTETDPDRQINIDWLNNNSHLNDNIIFSFSIMRIIPNTQVSRLKDNLGIILDERLDLNLQMKTWQSFKNPNTFKLREQWLKDHIVAARQNGFKLDSDLYSNVQARFILEKNLAS